MTTLIRSARFSAEPLVLRPHSRVEVPDGREGERRVAVDDAFPETEVLVPRVPEISPHEPYAEAISAGFIDRAEPPSEPERLTFEAFEERLAEDISRRRALANEEGYAAGHAAGLEAGRVEIRAELGEQVARLDSLREALVVDSVKALEETVDSAVEVVFEAIVRILGPQLADRHGAVAAVREAIRHCKDRTKLVARVAPADYQLISDQRGELTEAANGGVVEIVADDIVELGGCVLETPAGSLDARLEIQLQRLREALVSARQKSHDAGD